MRVWITRDEPPDGPLSRALARAGLTGVLEPVLATQVIGDARREIESLCDDDWLVLTSPRAVRSVARPRARPSVAVVGESSARIAAERGFRVARISASGAADDLWRHIASAARGRRVCFPRSSRSDLPALAGIDLTAPVIYNVANRAFSDAAVRQCELAAFTSPSAVESVAAQLGDVPMCAAAIGAATRRALEQAGARVLLQATRPGFEALAAAIAQATPQGRR